MRQPLLAVERRHAAGAGGGDGLAIDVVDGIAAGEDALDVRGRRVRMRQADVAALIELELPRVGLRVRRVADGDEEALRRRSRVTSFVFRLRSLSAGDAALFRADHFVDGRVEDELDLRIAAGAVLHDLRGAQLLAAMDDRDLRWRTW